MERRLWLLGFVSASVVSAGISIAYATVIATEASQKTVISQTGQQTIIECLGRGLLPKVPDRADGIEVFKVFETCE